jgi:WD40 repeat protein
MTELVCRRVIGVFPDDIEIHFVTSTRLLVTTHYQPANLEYLGGAVRLITTKGRLLAKAFTGWGTGSAAVHPSGTEVACTARRSCIIRSLRSWRLPVVRELRLDGQSSHNLLYAADGRWLIWGGLAVNPLVRWDTTTWTPTPMAGFRQAVSCLALSCDGGLLLVGGWDGGMQVWDTERWQVTAEWQAPADPGLRGHPPSISALQLSPDRRLVYGGFGGHPYLCAYSFPEFIPVLQFDQPVRVHTAVLLPDGRTLASGDDAGDVKLWDTQTGALLGHYGTPPGARRVIDLIGGTGEMVRRPIPKAEVSSLAVSPDGKTLAAGDLVGRIHLLDLPN